MIPSTRRQTGIRIALLVILAAAFIPGDRALSAEATYNPQKANEHMRSAERAWMIAKILMVIGVAVIVAAIPIEIYRHRKKKARKATPPPTTPPPEQSPRADAR